MAVIWRNDGSGWKLLAAESFPDEATLHTLVEEAPQMLPLAGGPQPVIVGREVLLGNGYADLLAIEPTGRLVVIEVKLARNAEARRAVVAQVLTYAAFLKGLAPAELEEKLLARHLQPRGYSSLADACAANDQSGSFDAFAFDDGLRESLALGRFRLVIVLDEAPDELSRLVGYLESVTDKLVIDLVTISAYQIEGSQILVPQRVDPERQDEEATAATPSHTRHEGYLAPGADDFVAAINDVPDVEHRERMRRLSEWAQRLEAEKLARLSTYHGKLDRKTLLPRLQPENVGLVTIWNDNGQAYLQFWRSVFERRAPNSLPRVEELVAPDRVGQGTTTRAATAELFDALTAAYREAVANG